jgi:uncharacterized protein YecE (DUF72 family)
MRVRAGTSGFSYEEWRGIFYPEGLPAAERLGFYAGELPSVEINNTFYRMPKAELVSSWGSQVPDDFRFAIKASRRITHLQKLAGVDDTIGYLVRVTATLGDKLGAVLFQLPPFLRKDAALLDSCLSLLPPGFRAAVEFRHASWYSDEVYEVLRAKDAALCVGDAEEGDQSPPFVATASWGYLRLRAPDYGDAEIDGWAERIASQSWSEALAFFKHEQKGPELAKRLLTRLGDAAVRPGLAKAVAREQPMAATGTTENAPVAEPAAKPRSRRRARPT